MPVWRLLLPLSLALVLAGCGDDAETGSACAATDVRIPQVNLVLDGPGFFIVSGDGGLRYAPAGGFCFDASGLLVNGAGHRVQVYAPTGLGGFNQGQLSDVVVPTGSLAGSPFADYALDATGVLEAVYADATRDVLGKLAVATFPSPQNLAAEGGNVCRETLQSGVARRGEAGELAGLVEPGLPPPFTCDQGRLDLAVDGDGYFVLDDNGTMGFDRRIVLGTDAEANFVDGRGRPVVGYSLDDGGAAIPVLVPLAARNDEGALIATHVLPNGEIRADYSNGVSGVLAGQLVLARERRPGAAVDVPGAGGLGSVVATPH